MFQRARRKISMQKSKAEQLRKYAEDVAGYLSRPDRARNYTEETFAVDDIMPLSDDSAAVIFLKSSGKKALMYCYWYHSSGSWRNFIPTDSHILGMNQLAELKRVVEAENWKHNFVEVSE